MIIDRLFDAVAERGPVCVGLDTSSEILPEPFCARSSLPEANLTFNREIINATQDLVACYKVQVAHYEALGVNGLSAYRDTIAELRRQGALVIGDVKRGDIASTGAKYAQAHFSGDFEVDFVTVNPYMGSDVITPYAPYLQKGDKGLFVLIKTSNPSASDVQDLQSGDRPLYRHLAEQVACWGEEYRGEHGYSLVGAVVGATRPHELAEIRVAHPSLFLLVPGYGAQGGGGRDVAPAFTDRNGAVVNASRSILAAYRGKPDGEKRYAEYAREAVIRMQEEILRWLN